MIIGAACFPEKGDALFHERSINHNEAFTSIAYSPEFSKYMKLFRFKEFRKFLPATMIDEGLKNSGDPWYKFAAYVTDFNKVQLREINFSLWDLADETMSAFRPRTTKLGGLPNISFVLRKPEPLGSEFKDTGCKKIGCMKHLELQMGKLIMREKDFCKEIGATAACTLRMALAGNQEQEAGMRSGIKGDSWFGSVTCADELGARNKKAVLSVSFV